jgi:hypothetical protein
MANVCVCDCVCMYAYIAQWTSICYTNSHNFLLQVIVTLEAPGDGQRCGAAICPNIFDDMSSLPLLHLNFVYSDLTASQTPPDVAQTNIVSATPRFVPSPSLPRAEPGSSAAHPLLHLAFSISLAVPRCSVLNARVQLLQVKCVRRVSLDF